MPTKRAKSILSGPPKNRNELWLRPILFQTKDSETWSGLDFDDIDDGEPVAWTEEDIVHLHWKLLNGIEALNNPHSSLAEKLDLLRWIFTDAEHDRRPFSFVFCLRVVGCSPFSPTSYIGLVDPEEIRAWIRGRLRDWFNAAMRAYPAWVREIVVSNPDFIAARLEKNPQWLNEQISKQRDQADLFM